MKKTRINTVSIRHGLTQIYTVYNFNPLWSLCSLWLKIKYLCVLCALCGYKTLWLNLILSEPIRKFQTGYGIGPATIKVKGIKYAKRSEFAKGILSTGRARV